MITHFNQRWMVLRIVPLHWGTHFRNELSAVTEIRGKSLCCNSSPSCQRNKEKSNPKTFATIMLIALHTMGIKCIALTRAERKISPWYHTMSVLYHYILYMRGWFHIQNLDGVQRISEQGIKFVPNWNMKSVCSQWEYPALDKYMFNSHNRISHSR